MKGVFIMEKLMDNVNIMRFTISLMIGWLVLSIILLFYAIFSKKTLIICLLISLIASVTINLRLSYGLLRIRVGKGRII